MFRLVVYIALLLCTYTRSKGFHVKCIELQLVTGGCFHVVTPCIRILYTAQRQIFEAHKFRGLPFKKKITETIFTDHGFHYNSAPIRCSKISWSLIFEVRCQSAKTRKLCAIRYVLYSGTCQQNGISAELMLICCFSIRTFYQFIHNGYKLIKGSVLRKALKLQFYPNLSYSAQR